MENLDKKALQYLAGVRKTIEECGISMGTPQSHTPASINISANSGPELSNMLKDIMSLSGVSKSPMPHSDVLTPDAGPSKVVSNEPVAGHLEFKSGKEPSMKDLIDVMKDDEEVVKDSMNDQRVYNNSPEEEGKQAGNWPLDGDQDNNLAAAKDVVVDRNRVTAESLMAEYKKFVSEAKKSKCCCEEKGKKACPVHSKKKVAETVEASEEYDVFGDEENDFYPDPHDSDTDNELISPRARRRDMFFKGTQKPSDEPSGELGEFSNDIDNDSLTADMYESKPSAGLSKKKKSSLVKKGKKGGDIGKPGKHFKDVVAAAKKGGARDPEAVAAAAMWKNVKR